jgi:uncharacterized protein (TIGR00725 family)
MKEIIAIIGNANIDNDIEKQNIAFEIGKLIIDNGFLLATGGLGGVMEYASKGAKSSKKYSQNSIIGVLPDYHSENANEYIDLPISTGLGLTRNLILISMSNAIIAIGGGSGTLNEISAAWQMNKLIIALKTSGWSEKLLGQALDNRRNDIIFGAENSEKAIQILIEKLPQYIKNKFTGVHKTRISRLKAEQIIISYFSINKPITYLGQGSEGFVFTDDLNLYKLIDNETNDLDLFWKLSALSESINKFNDLTGFGTFSVFHLADEKLIIIQSEFIDSKDFPLNQAIDRNQFIKLLKEFKKINWVLTDFQPKNIRISKNNYLVVSDIGHSFFPYTDDLFKSMCRRAFVTFKIQNKLNDYNSFKKYLSPVNTTSDFSLLSDFEFDISEINDEFKVFYNKIITKDKKDVLNPLINRILLNKIEIKTVFDYGSGHGDISQMLFNNNYCVTAFEPDKSIIEKYQKTYYQSIDILDTVQKNDLLKTSKKFDCALCSLVLCHPLADNELQRIEIIDRIMEELIHLSSKYVLIVICNPLYTYQLQSNLQDRCLPDSFNYSNTIQFTKRIKSSNRERYDIHRPISFYEKLFQDHNLKIVEIHQTLDNEFNKNGISNSDFMLFLLEKL